MICILPLGNPNLENNLSTAMQSQISFKTCECQHKLESPPLFIPDRNIFLLVFPFIV